MHPLMLEFLSGSRIYAISLGADDRADNLELEHMCRQTQPFGLLAQNLQLCDFNARPSMLKDTATGMHKCWVPRCCQGRAIFVGVELVKEEERRQKRKGARIK